MPRVPNGSLAIRPWEKAINRRHSYVPGSEKSEGGTTNLVQKDEADPLGTADSVVRILKSMGVPIHEDQRLSGWHPQLRLTTAILC